MKSENVRKVRASRRGPATRSFAAAVVIAACSFATNSSTLAEDTGGWISQMLDNTKSASPTTSESGTSERRPSRRRQGVAAAERSEPRPRRTSTTSAGETSGLTGERITWQASSSCVPSALRGVLADLAGTFGPVTVTSTCRGRSQNRAAGGAGQSYHLSGEAVDFRVQGSTGSVYAYLAGNGNVGGLKHYGGGLFHIDTGPRRSW